MWRRLEVHAAQREPRAIERTAGFDELGAQPGRRELVTGKAAHKKAALICKLLRVDQVRAFEFGFGEAKRHRLDQFDLGNRNDELATARAILRLLRENLAGKIPRQQQHVVRHICEQLLRWKDFQVRARRVETLLDRAAVDNEIECLTAESAVIQKRAAFGRSTVDCNARSEEHTSELQLHS